MRKCRRSSFRAGRCETIVWKQVSRQEVRQILTAARKYELATRAKGRRNGALGTVALEVLELFINLINFKTGRLDPSIDTIMRMVKRSRDAVVRALKALRQHGFLDWIRRCVETSQEGKGPQIRQVSNAYRLSLPAVARRLLGWFGKAAPTPDDHVQERLFREAYAQVCYDSLTLAEKPMAVLDGRLAEALARLGAKIAERESARQAGIQSGSITLRG